ncbi:hypothetical protein L2U69_08155 [Zavarzinia compransoris]|uniref:hypothetical protein n=1 Tax=Zavarzinia marina TaxID=2911065 RepID=UPI001F26ECD5|nr:hypothetical protein [Zavarzinia marina]MCF4165611.1 hypothetical protein [Zavarzinia marina]
MMMRNTRIFALAGLLLGGTSALAAEPLVIAVPRDDGQGVTVYTRPGMTDQDYAALTGITPPPEGGGATILILEPGKPARWSNDAPDAVDRGYGGTGKPMARDLTKPDADPAPIARETEAQPIDLFDDPAPAEAGMAGAIQPRDGTWKLTQGTTDFSGCNESIRTMVSQLLSGRAMPAETRALTFKHPFEPEQVMFGADYNVTWTREGPNRWRGVGDLSDMVTEQAFTMDMGFVVAVAAPGAIDLESTVVMTFPPHLTKVMGGSCKGVTPAHLRRLD